MLVLASCHENLVLPFLLGILSTRPCDVPFLEGAKQLLHEIRVLYTCRNIAALEYARLF